jgi:hypothetical protein
MKKLLVISLFVILQTEVFAQKYYPVGTMWEEMVCVGEKEDPRTSEHEYARIRSVVTGDSVVNGTKYKLVRTLFVEGGLNLMELRTPLYLIREHGDSVFRWDGYNGVDRLVCTFDWTPGGKFYYAGTWGESAIGEIKQEELLDGHLYDYVTGGYPKVIRTIGSLWYGLLDCQDFSNGRGFLRLTHFERHGKVIYHRDVEAPASFREDRSLFPTGTEWREASCTPGSPVRYDDYAIGEETVVGQKTYRRVLKNGGDSGLLIREEGCCVWLLCDEYPVDIKLYDFDWLSSDRPVMEHLRTGAGGVELAAEGIAPADTYLQYTTQLNQYAFSHGRKIVYGVGCVSGSTRDACILGYKESAEPGTTKIMVVWFRRKTPSGAYGYDSSIPGDWLTGITSPTGMTAPTAQRLYDLQGRRVPSLTPSHSPLRKGIYIENGRKRVVSR